MIRSENRCPLFRIMRLALAARLPMIAPKLSTEQSKSIKGSETMVAAVRVHKTGGPEVLTFEDVANSGAGPGPDQDQDACRRRQFHRLLFPQRHVSVAVDAVHRRQRERRRSDRRRSRRDRPQGGRPRRLCRAARRLCGRARVRRRPRGEAAGQYQLRAGRRHDAQGHDRAISAQPHLQGRQGHHLS